VGTPPNRTAEKVCGPGNYVIWALPAAPSPPELAEKIHCFRGSTRHADLLPGGRTRTQPPPPTRDVAYRDGDGLFLTDQHEPIGEHVGLCDAGCPPADKAGGLSVDSQ